MMLTRDRLPANGILVDEAGIETGIWGKFRLKSAYQPVFRKEGDWLVPFAVEGRTLPCLEGGAVPPALFHASVAPSDRALLARLGRQLHFGNVENVTQPALALFVGLDADAFADVEGLEREIDGHAARQADAGIAAGFAIFVLRGHLEVDDDHLGAVAAVIHRHGMRVCLEENGPAFSSPSRLAAVAPDFLRVSADRLRPLTLEPSVQRMLQTMYGALAERRIAVLATGIEGPEDFASAFDVQSACFQGAYLARPGLAGSLLALAPLSADALKAGSDNVVPLFGQAS